MRLEVNQLNSEIKSAGQTIRIKYARRNISQVFYSHQIILVQGTKYSWDHFNGPYNFKPYKLKIKKIFRHLKNVETNPTK